MLDESRIKLMTRMASYEENEGKKMIPIGSYFRSDYISFQMVKTAISATIAFGLIFAMFIYYDLETFINNIYKLDIVSMARSVITYYCIFVGVYVLIAYILYSVRYSRAKQSLRAYYTALRKLSSMYENSSED